MVLSPDLLSVMVALRMAMPNSISLMFPMMLPRAFCGPPGKNKNILSFDYCTLLHTYAIYAS